MSSSTRPETVTERAPTAFPLYRVLLHNDDTNTMDHVVRTLMRVFRFDQSECERIMLEAHRNGVALCTVEPLEQAELHRDQLQSSSLIATIEPE
ncbi:MAG TPA: ATP-dependent Clp protease adaptor ClpS [Nitrospirota bacterium]|nr:ATP-dependent Clp protease adaptor ClpS [Nitrospirota bacterium]